MQETSFCSSQHRLIIISSPLCVCSGTSVSAEIEEAELEGGTKIQPVSVLFPEGSGVPAPPQSEVLLNIPAGVLWNAPRALIVNVPATMSDRDQGSHLEGFLRHLPTLNATKDFTSGGRYTGVIETTPQSPPVDRSMSSLLSVW